jgi:O-antigen ligase
MYWFILLFPLMIYPWGYDPNYTMPKVAYLNLFVLGTWLYIVLKKKYWTNSLRKSYLTVEYIVIVFICLVGVSTIFSVNRITSLYGTEYRYEGLLALFSYCSLLLFSYRLLDTSKFEKVIHGMSVISLIVSIYGILQHYSLDFFPRNSSKEIYDRSYAFFDNPNFFGSYLVLIMMVTISLYLTAKNKKLSVFYYLIICVTFIALIFSGTRSGWLGSFVGFLFMTIFVVVKLKNTWKRWLLLSIALGLILITINTLEKGSYSNRVNAAVSDSYQLVTNQSTGYEGSNRFFIWEKSFSLINTNFWLGSGPDTLEFVFPAKTDELEKYFGTSNIKVDKAHNEFLQIAITLGVPALLTYLFLLVIVLKRAFQAAKAVTGNEKILLMGLISAIIGYLVQAFFNISVVTVAPIFWALLGITLAKSELHLKNSFNKTSHGNTAENSLSV